jgi:hypothetical protein
MEKKKLFVLSDSSITILPPHKCTYCGNILLDAHQCKKGCNYCKIHVPENKECFSCGSQTFSPNQEINEIIQQKYKKVKVSCSKCGEKMELKDFESHLESGCKIDCPQKCDSKLLEKDLQKHLNEECENPIVGCVGSFLGCKEKIKRGLMKIHEMDCKEAKIIELIENQSKEIENQSKKIVNLENENLQQNKKIEILERQEERIGKTKRKIFLSKTKFFFWIKKRRIKKHVPRKKENRGRIFN